MSFEPEQPEQHQHQGQTEEERLLQEQEEERLYQEREAEAQRQLVKDLVEKKQRRLRTNSYIALAIGLAVIAGHIFFIAALQLSYLSIFKSIFFALAVFLVASGVWGLFEADRISEKEVQLSADVVVFLQENTTRVPYFTYILIACIVVVFIVQMATGTNTAVAQAALIKQQVLQNGQYWRVLTGAVLHPGVLYVLLNCWVLHSFGSLIEVVSNRVHLASVFLLSILGGALTGLLLMPNANTAGAAGGIAGIVGYLAIFGYRRKHQLPEGFLKSMIMMVALNAIFGAVAYQIVDNTALIGGLVVGVIYGLIQIPSDPHEDPRRAGFFATALGYASLVVFVDAAVLSVLLIRNIVTL